MEPKRGQIKSKNTKSKKTQKRKLHCLCDGEWKFYPFVKTNVSKDVVSTRMIKKLSMKLKLLQPESIEKAAEIILTSDKEELQTYTNSQHIFKLPKKGDEISSFVPVFAALSVMRLLPGGIDTIKKAVVTTSNARNQLLNGESWSGDIEISDNIILKLYKSGLVLYFKKNV